MVLGRSEVTDVFRRRSTILNGNYIHLGEIKIENGNLVSCLAVFIFDVKGSLVLQ